MLALLKSSVETAPLLRKPTVADVSSMLALMEPHMRSEALLRRSRVGLVERLRDYLVAERDGQLVGLASVSLVDEHLAEVGALVWDQPSELNELMQAVLDEARALGVKRAFVMAPDPAPFEPLGFSRTSVEALPPKRDRQCLRCSRLPRCRQVALVKVIEA